ncbi:hypothetical protein A5768_08130 [Mycolicibacterium fortuitum]|uniref:Uncharacterized protein n=1 Tax=Mycolicibacterium alvei TaxID=67081 RepID=A0A6N4V473_9MYCO|nr:ArdC-like ssDNA-binding domain-containing protein [Mycolicibacterium fortuitum]MCV6998682.1 ImmA/IrrE family metallo-endopeptidase [Mycolicibacterium alvei]OBG15043.1 hypothetical protein A5768_08130 [Mycolicibacterium fortuitum]BBX30657.1 hypothetical protein MALV_57820 [Mycolicibacterium alvei]
MCRSRTEVGGPRRCSGDTRVQLARASSLVATLEREETDLLQRLDQAGVGGGESQAPNAFDGMPDQATASAVSFADKTTRLEDIRSEIDTAIDNLGTAQNWAQWLEFTERFHNYSLNNQLLIAMQKPDATRVAGFNKWKELGRDVNKGEKAIWVLAPMIKKRTKDDGSGEDERVVIGFKSVPVFDVSQTSGNPLPEPPVVSYSRDSGVAPPRMHSDLEAQVVGHGYRVERRDLGPDAAEGYTDGVNKVVVISNRYSDAHQAQVLAHELAHIELGHMGNTSDYHTRAGGQRPRMEVEAESVAYVVGRRYGLSPGPSSFAYIDGWAHGDKDKVRGTAEAVVAASKRILDRITS